MAAARRIAKRGVSPGTICANCVEAPATHMGVVDHESGLYPLCDRCELPRDARRDERFERGWEPRGGALSREESTAGARRAMGNATYERRTRLAIRGGMAPGHRDDDAAIANSVRYDGMRRARSGASRIRGRRSSRGRTVR